MDILMDLLSPKFWILYAFLAGALYVHFRGRVRHTFVRQLTDHSSYLAPYNVLMYAFSAVPTTPFVDLERFPELASLRENWQAIRDEAAALYETGHVKASDKYDDLGFNSFFRSGWKRFYLKWYDDFLPSAQKLCPRTVELLQQTPSINAAAFTCSRLVGKKLKEKSRPTYYALKWALIGGGLYFIFFRSLIQ